MKNFHLELGPIHKIVQGAVGDQAWGHYQFPTINYTKTGALIVYWSYGEDKVGGANHDGGVRPPYVSYDGGVTWGPNEKGEEIMPRIKMKNGKYFAGFCGRAQLKADYALDKEPAVRWDNMRMYFAEDFGRIDDTIVKARIYDPETDTTEIIEPTVHWPYAPLVIYPGEIVYPVTQIFSLNGHSLIEKDGVLYIAIYMYGFNSAAKSREEAILPYNKFSVYVFSSEDCGLTWNYLSQLSPDKDTYNPDPGFEGLDEPMMTVAPDGSIVMLIRTGGNHTSYIVHSTDGCKTWTKPAKFDDFGVFPQLLTFPCGVTLAGYGRPYMRIRATADPAAMTWEDPIPVELSGGSEMNPAHKSCHYVRFLPTSDSTALWLYTEFRHPNENGEPAKAVLVREVKIVED